MSFCYALHLRVSSLINTGNELPIKLKIVAYMGGCSSFDGIWVTFPKTRSEKILVVGGKKEEIKNSAWAD